MRCHQLEGASSLPAGKQMGPLHPPAGRRTAVNKERSGQVGKEDKQAGEEKAGIHHIAHLLMVIFPLPASKHRYCLTGGSPFSPCPLSSTPATREDPPGAPAALSVSVGPVTAVMKGRKFRVLESSEVAFPLSPQADCGAHLPRIAAVTERSVMYKMKQQIH